MPINIEHGLGDGDLDRVFNIEKECFNPGYRWIKAQLPDVRRDLDFWLARSQNELVGFLAAQPDGGYAHIENIAVLPKHRGQGLASQMIEACCAYFKGKGFRKSSLHVYAENPALVLYFKLGYRPYSITRGEHRTVKMVRVL